MVDGFKSKKSLILLDINLFAYESLELDFVLFSSVPRVEIRVEAKLKANRKHTC